MAESPTIAFRGLARRLFGESLLLALLVTFFAIVAVPEWDAKGYEVVRPPDPTLEDVPPEIDLPSRPEEPPRPEIPVEADEDEDLPDEATIPQNILNENAPPQPCVLPSLPELGDFVAHDTPPAFIRFVAPEYPRIALLSQVEGVVVVNLLVDTNGRVVDAVARTGPEILRQAAVEAALQCLLTPALQGDRPVPVWVALPFRFTLADAR
jgi:TonB family protein